MKKIPQDNLNKNSKQIKDIKPAVEHIEKDAQQLDIEDYIAQLKHIAR